MKAITLYQPYASLWACQAKRNETRSWHTWYTGPLAIHAAQTEAYLFLATAPGRFRDALIAAGVDADNLPTGAVIATCNLRACVQIVNQSIIDALAPDPDEIAFGDWTLGRYAWIPDEVRSLAEPIPAQGHQRIWNWDPPDFTNVSLERMSIDMSDLEELEIKADFFGKEFPDESASPNPAD